MQPSIIRIMHTTIRFLLRETYEEDGTFLFARERADVIERERDLGGYFAIVISEKMTAKEALELYKSRDASEKLFKGDKSYPGNKSLRVQGDEVASATQKDILRAFHLDVAAVKKQTDELSEMLNKYDRPWRNSDMARPRKNNITIDEEIMGFLKGEE